MLKKNSQRIHSHRNIWQTLESIQDWFTKSFKGKFMLSNHLTYLTDGWYIDEWTSEVLILQHVSGLRLTMTTTGSSMMNTMKQTKQSTIMQALSIPVLADQLQRLMVTLVEPNGSASSPKEEYILHRQTKKSVQISTHGLDTELRKFLKNLSRFRERWWYRVDNATLAREVPQVFSFFDTVRIPLENLKPTDGKKKASRKHKT